MRLLIAGLVLVLLSVIALMAPESRAEPEPAVPPGKTPSTGKPAFPASWVGQWKGAARSAIRGAPDREFTMELHVAPIPDRDAYTWTIVYGEGERRRVRAYEIAPVDAAAGHFRIDEKNSILIDAYLLGNALHSRFDVQNSSIDVRYVMQDGGIDVSLTTYAKSPPVTTSGGKNRIPEVLSYDLKAVQTARLTK